VRKIFQFVAAAVSLAVLLLTPSPAVADSVISVQAPATVAQGTNFVVDVLIAQVSDLYSFQFDLSFNPGVLKATKVLEGALLPTGGSTFFIPGTIDNTAGNITFNADTLVGSIPGVTGGGMLLEFEFTALANGTSPLGLSNVVLLDSNGNVIANSTTGGSVTVGGGSAVPESSTLLLLLAGLCSLVLVVAAKRS
jgi:general secretion pathway protein D